MARRADRRGGFNLITMSIVLAVAGIVMVQFLPETRNTLQKSAATIKNLVAVEKKLTGFMAFNGRLPCPADGSLAVNTTNFGREVDTSGLGSGNCTGAPLGPDAGTGYVVGGVIPTKSLNLDDSYAFDEWGRRITYVVDKRATKAGSGANSCLALENYPTNNGTGGIAIKNGSGTVYDNVMHAFISHGPDGHGAFPAQGSTVANRINTGTVDADKLTNAGVDASFNYSTANFTKAKVMKDRTATFGDIVYYAQRQKNQCCAGPLCSSTVGNIWVLDTNNNLVQKLNSSGVYQSQFGGTAGSGNGQFNFPYGIAIDASGNIYVADFNNNRVQKFNSSGTFLLGIGAGYQGVSGSIGSSGSGNGQFNGPYGIAIDASGNVYVADVYNYRVQKFNSSGTFLLGIGAGYQGVSGFIGTGGSANGQFAAPYVIAIDASGNIYVTDAGNRWVDKFNSSGVYQSKFGSAPQLSTGLNGIAIDASGNIYVLDSTQAAVLKFNSSGVYQSQFGTAGSGNGQFNSPNGIAIDASGNFWVGDMNNNRVEKFNSSGTWLQTIPASGCSIFSPACPAGSGNGQFNGPSGIAIH